MTKKHALTYSKQSGNNEIYLVTRDAKKTHQKDDIPYELEPPKLPSNYTKEDGTLTPSIICVISGGTTREKTFLMAVNKKENFKKIEVVFVSSPKGKGGLTPRMMLQEYYNISKNGHISLPGRNVKLEALDSIYMFTDVDHYENELKEILSSIVSKDQSQNHPKWIISNPDFEIWIYYCFYDNPTQDLKEVLEAIPSQRSSLLKTVNGKFNNGGGLDTRKAFQHLDEGIKHSKNHYTEVDGIPTLFSTQMHIFAEDVLEKIGDEYQAWKASLIQKRSMNRV